MAGRTGGFKKYNDEAEAANNDQWQAGQEGFKNKPVPIPKLFLWKAYRMGSLRKHMRTWDWQHCGPNPVLAQLPQWWADSQSVWRI